MHRGIATSNTVEGAGRSYVDQLTDQRRATRAATDGNAMFARAVYNTTLVAIPLERLTHDHLDQWRTELAKVPATPRPTAPLTRCARR
jgi:hypothetical protein